MFNNALVRSLCSASDEGELRLVEADWHRVLEANKNFTEAQESWRGDKVWGRYLCNKIGASVKDLDLSSSLELCCGNGFLFFSFRDLFEIHGVTSHIDLSEWQCNAFRQRCADANIPAPNIVCGDIGTLPYDDGAFNLVYGHSFLHHLPDVGLYLREALRVLAPGGMFVAFHEPTPTAPFWERFLASIYKKSTLGSLTDIWLISPNTITDLFRAAGYRSVRVYPSGLVASMMVTPIQMVRSKLKKTSVNDAVATARTLGDRMDRIFPRQIRWKYAPSIAICAVK